jgi:hypothetical protein
MVDKTKDILNDAIATTRGWLHPKTGELLVSIRGLSHAVEWTKELVADLKAGKNSVVEAVVEAYTEVKEDIAEVKADIAEMKADFTELKKDAAETVSDVKTVVEKVTKKVTKKATKKTPEPKAE